MSYAGIGWPVLPLRPAGKEPVTSRGVLQATDNPNQVEWFWKRTPDANIGLRTGLMFDVLDIDGPQGLASINRIAPGYRHEGPVAETSRGYHLLFEVTGRANFANPVGKESTVPGLDFRGRNGYIVAPPSVHPEGHIYQWAKSPMLPLPVAPDWLNALFPQDQPSAQGTSNFNPAMSLDLLAELGRIGAKLTPYGLDKYRGLCPFHPETHPSFVVYLNTDSFFCHGCRAWGDAFNVRRFNETGALR